jgi:hypothetical protein
MGKLGHALEDTVAVELIALPIKIRLSDVVNFLVSNSGRKPEYSMKH